MKRRMKLTVKQRAEANASHATHVLVGQQCERKVLTLVRSLPSFPGGPCERWQVATFDGDELGAWQETFQPGDRISELAPINYRGANNSYSRDDIRRHIAYCHPAILKTMSSEVYAYPETKRAPVTQQHADCWGVTVQQVWEWALPAFSRAVQAGYPVSIYVHPSTNTVGV